MSSRLTELLQRIDGYAELDCLAGSGGSYTYAQLSAERARWQQRLAELGIEPGQVVGLRADYSLASVAVLLALFARGNVVALIPRDRDASSYLEDARAHGLLMIDDGGVPAWRRSATPEDHPLLDALRDSGDSGIVIFTSGSTGRPKAALQSVDRFLHKFRKPGRRFRTLAFLLFDHIAGMDTLFHTLSSGGALIVTRNRSPGAILELIARERVEVLPASPSFLRLMCLAGDAGEADLGSLKIITDGSEPKDPSTLTWLNERFPSLQIAQKYGTTETGAPRSVSRGNDSLWLQLGGAGVQTRVVDGVLQLRGEGMILGYLNAPSPIDADGWYSTGDLVDVEADADGEWLRFRGRATDLISVGGEKVAPAEVEQVILELPLVKDAVVSGEQHVMMGEIVTARVTLAADVDLRDARKKIRMHCRSRLAPYKVPVKIDIVEGSLVNERQKAQRAGLSRSGH